MLEEAYPESDIVTRFYITPTAAATSNVRIWSELNSKEGMLGALERMLVRGYLRKVYLQEIGIGAAVA